MKDFNLSSFTNTINLFLENKNIDLDNLIIICLICFLISENSSDFVLIIILFLLIV